MHFRLGRWRDLAARQRVGPAPDARARALQPAGRRWEVALRTRRAPGKDLAQAEGGVPTAPLPLLEQRPFPKAKAAAMPASPQFSHRL